MAYKMFMFTFILKYIDLQKVGFIGEIYSKNCVKAIFVHSVCILNGFQQKKNINKQVRDRDFSSIFCLF